MWFAFSFVRLLRIWCLNCVPEVTLDPAYFNLGTRPIYLATSPLVPQFQLPQATLPHTSMRDAILVWFLRQLSKRNVLMESTILFHRHVHVFSPCSVILILKDTIRNPCSNFSLHRGCLHSSVSKCCKSTPHPTTPLVPQFQLPQATLPHTSMRDAILVWFQRQLSKRNVLMESTILFHRHVHVFLHVPSSWSWKTPSVVPAPIFLCIVVAYTPVYRNAANQHPIQPHLWCRNFSCHRRHCLTHQCVMPYSFDFSGNFPKESTKCSDGINNFAPIFFIVMFMFFLHVPSSWSWKTQFCFIRSPCSNFSLHRGCLHSSVSKCCKSTPHPTTPLVPQFQLPQATLPHTSMRDAILVWFQRQLSKTNVLMESTILFHRHVHDFFHVPSSWSWKTPSVVPAPIFLCIVVAYTPVYRNAANQHPIQPHLWCRNFRRHRRHCLTHQCVMPYSFDFSGNFPKEMFWWNQQFCFIVMFMFFLHVPSSWSWKTPSVVPAPIFLCIVVAYTPVYRNAANQHPIQPHLWCRNFSCHRRHCLTHQCVMPYSFDFSGNFPKEMFWWNQQFCFIVMFMFFLHVPSSWSWKTPSVVPAPIFLCIVVAYTPVYRNAANQHPIQPHLWCRNFRRHRRHCLTHQCVMPYSFDFSGNFPKEMFWWNQQFCFIVMFMFFLHVPSSWSWKTPSVVPAPIFLCIVVA